MSTDTKSSKEEYGSAVYPNLLFSVDCHSHVLPGIDDGPDSVEESVKMLEILKAQGVSVVYATPHFHAHKESVRDFLARRQEALDEVLLKSAKAEIPQIKLGAEIAIERNISNNTDIDMLTMDGSQYILLELPYKPYSRQVAAEIENIMYGYSLIPIIAHLDRYSKIFSKENFDEVFQLTPAIFQINVGALGSPYAGRLISHLKRKSFPTVLGSDCHNLNSRKPNFDISVFKKKKVSANGISEQFLKSSLKK